MFLIGLCIFPIMAQSQPHAHESFGEGFDAPAVYAEPAPRIADGSSSPALAIVEAAPVSKIVDMLESNATRRQSRREQNGFLRDLPTPITVDIKAGNALTRSASELVVLSSQDVYWSARLVVESSYAFRFRLDDVNLPPGTRIWVHDEDGELGPFTPDLVNEGVLWLPAVNGPAVHLEVAVPKGAFSSHDGAHFRIDQVMEIFDLAELRRSDLWPKGLKSCSVDTNCVSTDTFGEIDALQQSTAHLEFVDNGMSFVCSGNMVGDVNVPGFIPYLLTANNCFDSAASAASLTAYFDFDSVSCDSNPPQLGTVDQVSGATLLATSPDSDFTFVRLNDSPKDFTWYLGWASTDPAFGTTLHRAYHSDGVSMRYSSQINKSSDDSCSALGLPSSQFHTSQLFQGSSPGGRSGSALVNHLNQIVGQLSGACGGGDACDYTSYVEVDGKFSVTYPSIVQWLNPDDYAAFGQDSPCDACQSFGPGSVDFSVPAASVSNATPAVGEQFNLNLTVRNSGDAFSETFLRAFESQNSTISTFDTQIDGQFVSIAANSEVQASFPITKGSSGTFFFGACADAAGNESNPDNQCSVGVQVNVGSGGAELSIPAVSVSNDMPAVDEQFILTVTVENSGDVFANAFLRAFQSDDQIISTSDSEISGQFVGVGANSAVQATFPITVSSSDTLFFGACADAVPGESNTDDQCSAAVRVDVGVQPSLPDLVVVNPAVSNSSPGIGEAFTIEAVVFNDGGSTSAATTLRYYRSTDVSITTSDTQIATDSVPALAVNASSPESASVSISSAGTFFVGACVDPVDELNNNNQCSLGIRVDVQESGEGGFIGAFAPETWTPLTQTFGCGASSITADASSVLLSTGTGCAAIAAVYRHDGAPEDGEISFDYSVSTSVNDLYAAKAGPADSQTLLADSGNASGAVTLPVGQGEQFVFDLRYQSGGSLVTLEITNFRFVPLNSGLPFLDGFEGD